jgi:general secretion pathway protein D
MLKTGTKTFLAALASLFLLISCDDTGPGSSSGAFGPDGARRSGGGAGGGLGFADRGDQFAVDRGSDAFFDRGALQSGKSNAVIVPSGGDKVEISLVNASVGAAAKVILGDTLKLDYVIGDGVEGTVTIQTTGPVPKDMLLELFEAALSANGAQLQKSGDVVQIVRGGSGNRTFRLAAPGNLRGASILVAPLEYVSAAEMLNLLQPLIDDGLTAVADKRRNLLLLSGTPAVLEAALDTLNIFDVDVLEGKSVALVRLNSGEPEATAEQARAIFDTDEGEALDGVVEFIPNERLGSILIVSSRSAYLDRAVRWVRELDRPGAGAGLYLATYELQNRSAVDVAPILADLLGTGGVSGDEALAREGDVGQGGGSRVAADDSRNALVVRAPREQHAEIAALLRELDSPARQVLLEATIAEVTLNDRLDVGTRWFFERGNWDFRFSNTAGAIVGNPTGFTAVFGVGGADVALSALASVTDVKVISSPTLMVIDNKEGVLQIGDQVPIATTIAQEKSSGDAPILTQIEYRDTGIILRVRPRVGTGGRVTLEISQEVSDVQATTTSDIDSPTISQRKVQTSVALSDGQTLALGGLVTESDNVTKSEVPGLGKIPVLGNLFKAKDSRRDRTELLILIRPRVILNDEDAGAATSYWRTKLTGAGSMLQTGLGQPRHRVSDLVD